jgi:hypothetical protein
VCVDLIEGLFRAGRMLLRAQERCQTARGRSRREDWGPR